MGRKLALVGTRRQSRNDAKLLFQIGFLIAASGGMGRSGGAPGADTSFEKGMEYYLTLKRRFPDLPGDPSKDPIKVYLPSFRFSNRQANGGQFINASKLPNHKRAMEIASQFHGGWDYLPEFAKLLMARNGNQVLGDHLYDPVDQVLCLTPDGATSQTNSKTGGTGQAIRIANAYDIPVTNLGNLKDRYRFEKRIERNKERFAPWVDLDLIYEKACWEQSPLPMTEGNLLDRENLANIDVLVHGANCQHTMKSGIAKQISEMFPEAVEADLATPKGVKKLGSYSFAEVMCDGLPLTIVNAYTQKRPATRQEQSNGDLLADYDAIRKVMKQIGKDFSGKKKGMPMIGAGLANGCWLTISNLICESNRPDSINVFSLQSPENALRKNPGARRPNVKSSTPNQPSP